jgi:beta-lactamase regulating signal transducer with metallopeptidase domain
MHPETQLAIVAAFAGFLLKTSLGFCLCWVISKILVFPRSKFLVWFAYLLVAAGYWLFVIASFIPHRAQDFALPLQAAGSSAPIANWQFPLSWAYPLLVVERSFGGLYLIALAYFLAVRIKKQLRLRWVVRFAYKAPDRIDSMFRSIASRLGAEQIRLLVLSGIYSPATFGWIHPVVLLPPLCLEQDESELADIFRHELQHVARRDFFFHNVARLCRALLFFHPAVWYAVRRMELESELICDLAVVRNSPERRATYAECLVRFARLHATQDPTPWNLDFAGSAIQLKVRVRSVLTDTAKLPPWLMGLRVSMGMLLVAAFLCVAPSLGIVLSYAHRVAQQPVIPSLVRTRAHVQSRKRSLIRKQDQENLVSSMETAATAIRMPEQQSASTFQPTPAVTRLPDTLSSGEPVPTLQRRGTSDTRATRKPAQATAYFISNPSGASSPGPSTIKGRSITSALMTGAGEAVRFAGSHGKEIH